MKEKKQRKTNAEQLLIVEKLRPIDDGFFEVMMEDPDTCEELLQIFMEKADLKIRKDTVTGQKSIHIIGKRSIRVDAYAITVNRSEPGDRFEHVQEVYIIYVSNFDVLQNGRTISHAEMICKETGESLQDGLHEIYVTTTGKEDNKIARLMKEFLNPDMNNPEFPKTSRRVQAMKHDPKEVAIVCKAIEEYADKRAIETAIETYQECGISRDIIVQKIKNRFALSDDQIAAYLKTE